MKKQFHKIKGTYDILPNDQPYWEKIYKVLKDLAEDYGFQRIDTPIIEETDLFTRGIGLATDIIEKQMFSFKTKGKDDITLRPEGTAGVIRAYIENGMINLPQPVKLYYIGPMFRYEQPQAGRFRQFQQFGLEVIGAKDPIIDAQVILFFFRILGLLGIKKINVQINSIGCLSCRAIYRKALIDYYRDKLKKICADCRKRFKINPLRLLDCKKDKCQTLIKEAPSMIDYLCDECRVDFKKVLEFLDELEIPYFLNRSLVRGLDYYTKTVFEIWPEQSEWSEKQVLAESGLPAISPSVGQSRQIALAGGGRYDNLMKLLGGKDSPAMGAAAGIERIVSLMKEKQIKIKESFPPDIFLVQLGDLAKRKSLKLFDQLQKEGIRVAESFSRDSIKSQLKIADKVGAKLAIILGQQEVLDETVIIRDMDSGVQEIVPIDKIIKELKKRIKRIKR